MRRMFLLILVLPCVAVAASLVAGPWPNSSDRPVEPLGHPSLAARVDQLGDALDDGFRLIAFGDQRALADGEWQAMNQIIRSREDRGGHALPLLSIVDTGDIVFDGNYSDQFHMLADILTPLRPWPYLVGIGNHEVHNNGEGPSRGNTVAFLGGTVGALADQAEAFALREKRLYYRIDVGGVRLISLDTNDLVYGPNGDRADTPGLTYRGRAQLRWLAAQLADDRGAHTTIVLCHHPFVHSSEKHRGQARKMWSLTYQGRTIPEMLAAGGVDLVLVGHTHTYERFRLTNAEGSFQLMNVSGRPRNAALWYGKKQRRAHDVAGREIEFLRDEDWTALEGWTIEQLDAMTDDERNQFVELRVSPEGLEAEVFYLVDRGRGGIHAGGSFRVD